MKNVQIKGVWYTENDAMQKGLLKKKVKPIVKEEKTEHKKKFDKKD